MNEPTAWWLYAHFQTRSWCLWLEEEKEGFGTEAEVLSTNHLVFLNVKQHKSRANTRHSLRVFDVILAGINDAGQWTTVLCKCDHFVNALNSKEELKQNKFSITLTENKQDDSCRFHIFLRCVSDEKCPQRRLQILPLRYDCCYGWFLVSNEFFSVDRGIRRTYAQ